jgi:Ca2+-binding EF-hand superfamily protein
LVKLTLPTSAKPTSPKSRLTRPVSDLVFLNSLVSLLNDLGFSCGKDELTRLVRAFGVFVESIEAVHYVRLLGRLGRVGTRLDTKSQTFVRHSLPQTPPQAMAVILRHSDRLVWRYSQSALKKRLLRDGVGSPSHVTRPQGCPSDTLEEIRSILESQSCDLQQRVIDTFGDLGSFVAFPAFRNFLSKQLKVCLHDDQLRLLFDSLVKERSGEVRLLELVKAVYSELTEQTFQTRSDEDNLLLRDFASMLNHQFESVESIRRVIRHWDPVLVAVEEFMAFTKSFCRFTDSQIRRLFDRIRNDHDGVMTEAGVLTLLRTPVQPTQDNLTEPGNKLLGDLIRKENKDIEAVTQCLSNDPAVPPTTNPSLSPLDQSSHVLLQLLSSAQSYCERHKLTFQQLFAEFSVCHLMAADQFVELLNALCTPAKFTKADSSLLFLTFRNRFSKHLTVASLLKMLSVARKLSPVKVRLIHSHGRLDLDRVVGQLKTRMGCFLKKDLDQFVGLVDFMRVLHEMGCHLSRTDLDCLDDHRLLVEQDKGVWVNCARLWEDLGCCEDPLEEAMMRRSAAFILLSWRLHRPELDKGLSEGESVQTGTQPRQKAKRTLLKTSKTTSFKTAKAVDPCPKPARVKQKQSPMDNPSRSTLSFCKQTVSKMINKALEQAEVNAMARHHHLNRTREEVRLSYVNLIECSQTRIGQSEGCTLQLSDTAVTVLSSSPQLALAELRIGDSELTRTTPCDFGKETVLDFKMRSKCDELFVLTADFKLAVFRWKGQGFELRDETVLVARKLGCHERETVSRAKGVQFMRWGLQKEDLLVVNLTLVGMGLVVVDAGSRTVVTRMVAQDSELVVGQAFTRLAKLLRSKLGTPAVAQAVQRASTQPSGQCSSVGFIREVSECSSKGVAEEVSCALSELVFALDTCLRPHHLNQVLKLMEAMEVWEEVDRKESLDRSRVSSAVESGFRAVRGSLEANGKSIDDIARLFCADGAVGLSRTAFEGFFKDSLVSLTEQQQREFFAFIVREEQVDLGLVREWLSRPLGTCRSAGGKGRISLDSLLGSCRDNGICLGSVLESMESSGEQSVSREDFESALKSLPFGLDDLEITRLMHDDFVTNQGRVFFDKATLSSNLSPVQDCRLVIRSFELLSTANALLATAHLPTDHNIYLLRLGPQPESNDCLAQPVRLQTVCVFQPLSTVMPQQFRLIECSACLLSWDCPLEGQTANGPECDHSASGNVRLFRLDLLNGLPASIRPSTIIQGPLDSFVTAVHYLSSNRLLAVAFSDGTVRLFDPTSPLSVDDHSSVEALKPGSLKVSPPTAHCATSPNEIKRIYVGSAVPVGLAVGNAEVGVREGHDSQSQSDGHSVRGYVERLVVLAKHDSGLLMATTYVIDRLTYKSSYRNRKNRIPKSTVSKMSRFCIEKLTLLNSRSTPVEGEEAGKADKDRLDGLRAVLAKGFRSVVLARHSGRVSEQGLKDCLGVLTEFGKGDPSVGGLYQHLVELELLTQEQMPLSIFRQLVEWSDNQSHPAAIAQSAVLAKLGASLRENHRLVDQLLRHDHLTVDVINGHLSGFLATNGLSACELLREMSPYSADSVSTEVFRNTFREDLIESKLAVFGRGTRLTLRLNSTLSKQTKLALLQQLMSADCHDSKLVTRDSMMEVFDRVIKSQTDPPVEMSPEQLDDLFVHNSVHCSGDRLFDLRVFGSRLLDCEESCELERVYHVLGKVKAGLLYTGQALEGLFGGANKSQSSVDSFQSAVTSLLDNYFQRPSQSDVELMCQFLATTDCNGSEVVDYSVVDCYLTKLESRFLFVGSDNWEALHCEVQRLVQSVGSFDAELSRVTSRDTLRSSDVKAFLWSLDYLSPETRDYLFVKFGSPCQSRQQLFHQVQTHLKDLKAIENKDMDHMRQMVDNQHFDRLRTQRRQSHLIDRLAEVALSCNTYASTAHLSSLFQAFDRLGTGLVSLATFHNVMAFNAKRGNSGGECVEFQAVLSCLVDLHRTQLGQPLVDYGRFIKKFESAKMSRTGSEARVALEEVLVKINKDRRQANADLKGCLGLFDKEGVGKVGREELSEAFGRAGVVLSGKQLECLVQQLGDGQARVGVNQLMDKLGLVELGCTPVFDWAHWAQSAKRLSARLKMKLAKAESVLFKVVQLAKDSRKTNLMGKVLLRELLSRTDCSLDADEVRVVADYAVRGSSGLTEEREPKGDQLANLDHFCRSFEVIRHELAAVETTERVKVEESLLERRMAKARGREAVDRLRGFMEGVGLTLGQVVEDSQLTTGHVTTVSKQEWLRVLRFVPKEVLTLGDRLVLFEQWQSAETGQVDLCSALGAFGCTLGAYGTTRTALDQFKKLKSCLVGKDMSVGVYWQVLTESNKTRFDTPSQLVARSRILFGDIGVDQLMASVFSSQVPLKEETFMSAMSRLDSQLPTASDSLSLFVQLQHLVADGNVSLLKESRAHSRRDQSETPVRAVHSALKDNGVVFDWDGFQLVVDNVLPKPSKRAADLSVDDVCEALLGELDGPMAPLIAQSQKSIRVLAETLTRKGLSVAECFALMDDRSTGQVTMTQFKKRVSSIMFGRNCAVEAGVVWQSFVKSSDGCVELPFFIDRFASAECLAILDLKGECRSLSHVLVHHLLSKGSANEVFAKMDLSKSNRVSFDSFAKTAKRLKSTLSLGQLREVFLAIRDASGTPRPVSLDQSEDDFICFKDFHLFWSGYAGEAVVHQTVWQVQQFLDSRGLDFQGVLTDYVRSERQKGNKRFSQWSRNKPVEVSRKDLQRVLQRLQCPLSKGDYLVFLSGFATEPIRPEDCRQLVESVRLRMKQARSTERALVDQVLSQLSHQSQKDRMALDKVFVEMTSKDEGRMGFGQFEKFMEAFGVALSGRELRTLFELVDVDRNHWVDLKRLKQFVASGTDQVGSRVTPEFEQARESVRKALRSRKVTFVAELCRCLGLGSRSAVRPKDIEWFLGQTGAGLTKDQLEAVKAHLFNGSEVTGLHDLCLWSLGNDWEGGEAQGGQTVVGKAVGLALWQVRRKLAGSGLNVGGMFRCFAGKGDSCSKGQLAKCLQGFQLGWAEGVLKEVVEYLLGPRETQSAQAMTALFELACEAALPFPNQLCSPHLAEGSRRTVERVSRAVAARGFSESQLRTLLSANAQGQLTKVDFVRALHSVDCSLSLDEADECWRYLTRNGASVVELGRIVQWLKEAEREGSRDGMDPEQVVLKLVSGSVPFWKDFERQLVDQETVGQSATGDGVSTVTVGQLVNVLFQFKVDLTEEELSALREGFGVARTDDSVLNSEELVVGLEGQRRRLVGVQSAVLKSKEQWVGEVVRSAVAKLRRTSRTFEEAIREVDPTCSDSLSKSAFCKFLQSTGLGLSLNQTQVLLDHFGHPSDPSLVDCTALRQSFLTQLSQLTPPITFASLKSSVQRLIGRFRQVVKDELCLSLSELWHQLDPRDTGEVRLADFRRFALERHFDLTLQEMGVLFGALDQNDDGRIDLVELAAVLGFPGQSEVTPVAVGCEAEVVRLIAEKAVARPGRLSLEGMKRAFELVDSTAKGYLTWREMGELLGAEVGIRLGEGALRALARVVNPLRSDCFHLDEFMACVSAAVSELQNGRSNSVPSGPTTGRQPPPADKHNRTASTSNTQVDPCPLSLVSADPSNDTTAPPTAVSELKPRVILADQALANLVTGLTSTATANRQGHSDRLQSVFEFLSRFDCDFDTKLSLPEFGKVLTALHPMVFSRPDREKLAQLFATPSDPPVIPIPKLLDFVSLRGSVCGVGSDSPVGIRRLSLTKSSVSELLFRLDDFHWLAKALNQSEGNLKLFGQAQLKLTRGLGVEALRVQVQRVGRQNDLIRSEVEDIQRLLKGLGRERIRERVYEHFVDEAMNREDGHGTRALRAQEQSPTDLQLNGSPFKFVKRDSERVVSEGYRLRQGLLGVGPKAVPVRIRVYSDSVLDHPLDKGRTMRDWLVEGVGLQRRVQQTFSGDVLAGQCGYRIDVDEVGQKTMMVFEELLGEEWVDLRQLVQRHGGLMRDPVALASNSVSKVVVHFLSRLGGLLTFLHSCNAALMALDPSSVMFNKRTFEVKLQSLEHCIRPDGESGEWPRWSWQSLRMVVGQSAMPFVSKDLTDRHSEFGFRSDSHLLGSLLFFVLFGEPIDRNKVGCHSVFPVGLFEEIERFDFGLVCDHRDRFSKCIQLSSFVGEAEAILGSVGVAVEGDSGPVGPFAKLPSSKRYSGVSETGKALDLLSLLLEENPLRRPLVEAVSGCQFASSVGKALDSNPQSLSRLLETRRSSKAFVSEVSGPLMALTLRVLTNSQTANDVPVFLKLCHSVLEHLDPAAAARAVGVPTDGLCADSPNNNFVSFVMKYQVIDLLLFNGLLLHKAPPPPSPADPLPNSPSSDMIPHAIRDVLLAMVQLTNRTDSLAVSYVPEIIRLVVRLACSEPLSLPSQNSDDLVRLSSFRVDSNRMSEFSQFEAIKSQFAFLTSALVSPEAKKRINDLVFESFYLTGDIVHHSYATELTSTLGYDLLREVLGNSMSGTCKYLNVAKRMAKERVFWRQGQFFGQSGPACLLGNTDCFDAEYLDTLTRVLDISRQVQLCSNSPTSIRLHLNFLDSIVGSGSAAQLGAVIDSKVFAAVVRLTAHRDSHVREEALEAIEKVALRVCQTRGASGTPEKGFLGRELTAPSYSDQPRTPPEASKRTLDDSSFRMMMKELGMASHIMAFQKSRDDPAFYLECLGDNRDSPEGRLVEARHQVLSLFLQSETFVFSMVVSLKASAELSRNRMRILRIAKCLCGSSKTMTDLLSLPSLDFWQTVAQLLLTNPSTKIGKAAQEYVELAKPIFAQVFADKRPELLADLQSVPCVGVILREHGLTIPPPIKEDRMEQQLSSLRRLFEQLQGFLSGDPRTLLNGSDAIASEFHALLRCTVADTLSLARLGWCPDSPLTVSPRLQSLVSRLWTELKSIFNCCVGVAFLKSTFRDICSTIVQFANDLFCAKAELLLLTLEETPLTIEFILCNVSSAYATYLASTPARTTLSNYATSPDLLLSSLRTTPSDSSRIPFALSDFRSFSKNLIFQVATALLTLLSQMMQSSHPHVRKCLVDSKVGQFVLTTCMSQWRLLHFFVDSKLEDLSVLHYYVEEVNVRLRLLHLATGQEDLVCCDRPTIEVFTEYLIEHMCLSHTKFDMRFFSVQVPSLPFKDFQPFRTESLFVMKLLHNSNNSQSEFQIVFVDKLFHHRVLDKEFRTIVESKDDLSVINAFGIFNVVLSFKNHRINFYCKQNNFEKVLRMAHLANPYLQAVFGSFLEYLEQLK